MVQTEKLIKLVVLKDIHMIRKTHIMSLQQVTETVGNVIGTNAGDTRPPAVIFDRDGSMASVSYIAPTDKNKSSWRQFNAALIFDAVVPEVAAILHAVRPGVVRIMTSGRAEGDHPGDRRRRMLMKSWLHKHSLPIDLLFMREGGDQRVDSTVKREIFQRHIEPFFDVRYVIDDRPQVVQAWRDLGLHVLQVKDPGILPPIARLDVNT